MLGHNQLNVIEDSAFAATEMIEMLILNNNPIKVSKHSVEKWKFALTEKKINQINHLALSSVKPLISRNFVKKVWERIAVIYRHGHPNLEFW